MVRKISIYILCLFVFVGCYSYKNEYGSIRSKINKSNYKKKINKDVYEIIDTTKLYKMVSWISIKDEKAINRINEVSESYIKFYNQGKFSEFNSYKEDNFNSLNPQKSEENYYYLKNKELILQYYFQHPQGGGKIKSKLLNHSSDTLAFISDNTIIKYIAIDLPKEFLIYKPDW